MSQRIISPLIIGSIILLTTLAIQLQVSSAAASNLAALNCSQTGIVCSAGTLSSDTIWTAANIYVMTDDVEVPAGITLTIEQGTVIKGANTADLVVEGILDAQGTPDQPVYFTSLRDDTIGGDTNNDGNATTPAPDDWDNIQYLNGTGSLSHVEIRFSGGNQDQLGAIYIDGGTPTLDHITVRNSARYALSIGVNDPLSLSNLVVEATPYSGIEVRSGELAADTTWNSTETVYILTDDITVPSGTTLALAPGVVVKIDGAADIDVTGVVNMSGTLEQPIILTRIKDDSILGDTNGDGDDSQPAADDWDSLVFRAGSAGLLTYVDLRYGGGDPSGGVQGMVSIEDSSPVLANCVIQDSTIGVRVSGDQAQPKINQCDIYGNTAYGIQNRSSATIVDATENWWGSSLGPNDPSDDDGQTNKSIAGDRVSDGVRYTPFRTSRTQTTMIVSDAAIAFHATMGSQAPGGYPLQIRSEGPENVSWSMSEDIPWLRADTVTGTTPTTTNLTVDPSGLDVGVYSGDVLIQGERARQRMQRVTVTLTVVDTASAAPSLAVDSSSLVFAARSGTAMPASQVLTIRNTGTGTLLWTASEDIPWLSLSATSGVARAEIAVSVDTTGLVEPVYEGTITVTGTNATTPPQVISVTLIIGCASVRSTDVMIVLDRSGSMAEPDISTFLNAQEAARQFIRRTNFATDQVGLVSFTDVAALEAPLSREPVALQRFVDNVAVDEDGNTNIAAGIEVAQQELLSERRNPNSVGIIVLLSDGDANRGGNPVVSARAAKESGITIVTVGLGEVDVETLQAIASSPNDFYLAPASDELIGIFNRIAVNVGCAVRVLLPIIRT